PTTVPRSSHRLSGDWPGKVSAALEGPPVLVVQGAGGNASWDRGVDVAAAVAKEAQELLRKAEPVRHIQIGCQARFVALPPPQASPAIPWLFRRAFANSVAIVRQPVALETSVVAQGLPPPLNLEAARRCAAAVRAQGAVPAAIAVIEGRVVVGASEAELRRLADPSRKPAKAGSRDLAAICARGLDAG